MRNPNIWCLIRKQTRQRRGGYQNWKDELAAESGNRCVYCGIHDELSGGVRSFHVDHFRPRQDWPDLEDDYNNLFYSCPVCNAYKGREWPGDPDVTRCTFLCPSEHDFSMYIIARETTLAGRCIATEYMIERLHLNRPRLQILRREAALRRRLRDEEGSAVKIRQEIEDVEPYGLPMEFCLRLIRLRERITAAYNALLEIYETGGEDVEG